MLRDLKNFLISKIPTIQVLRSKYLDIILKELENIKSKVKFDKEFHKSYTINLWKDEYNREVNYINSLDFYNSLRDFPGRIIPEKYPFENIANSLYNKIKITENIQYRITEKELATKALIIAFESAPDNVKISLLNKYNSDLISNNYKNDYIIVNSELKPIKNDLVYFNEVKAFHYMME